MIVALAAALYLFQPWRAFTNRTVVEALPSVAAATPQPAPTPATSSLEPSSPLTPQVPAPGSQPPAAPPSQAPAEITELSTGSLISHEHTTSGTVSLLRLPDGSQLVRLTGLDTSDGPDLHVWLTDADVVDGRDGWFVFDDGRHVDLGPLKGNQGDQNYEIPAGTDIDGLDSVSIWCQRFAVSFGAAELAPPA